MYYLTNFCCFCLKERENLIDLSLRNFQHVNIINKLMFCIKDDLDTSKVPTFICQKCCTKLEEAYEFKKMSLGNWNRFQGYIRKLKYVNPNCKTKYVLNEIKILVSDVKLEEYEFKSVCQDEDHLDECFIKEESVETIENLLVEDKNNRTSEELNNAENRTEQLTDENAELSQDFFGETIKEEATIPDENLQCSYGVNFKYQVNCSKCDKTFKRKWHLDKHVEETHKEYRCSFCDKDFSLKRYLNIHMLIHENKRPFACSYCDRTFWKKRYLESHVEKQHRELTDPGNSLSCYRCNELFSSESKLKEHVLIHSDEKPYMCSICGAGFTRELFYRHHLYIHNEKDRPYFVCTVCNKRYTTKASLNLHMKGHSNKRPHACTMCDATFFRKDVLRKHILKHHSNSNKDLEETQECKKELHMDEELHSEENLVEKPVKSEPCDGFEFVNIQDGNTPMQVKCSKCHDIYKTKWYLERHIEEKHRLQCSLCDKRFSLKKYLNIHMLIHENKRPFACSYCDRTFWRKCLLESHVEKQHRELTEPDHLLSCNQCKEHFSSESELKEHVLIHLKEKPHICSKCGRRFKSKQNYQRHLYIHNKKNRPYFDCDLCNKRYTTKASLQYHLLGHSNKRPYACAMCDARFYRKDFLRNHILKHHSNSNKDFEETQECKKALHMLEELHPQKSLLERLLKNEPCDRFEFVNVQGNQDRNIPLQETGVSTLLVKDEKQTLNVNDGINENVEEGSVTLNLNDQEENKFS